MSKSTLLKIGRDIDNANAAAINRAAKSALTAASSFIRKKYNVKKKDLDKQFTIIGKATKESPFVIVHIKSKPLSLKAFKPKQIGKIGRPKKKRKASGKGGVKVTVIKGHRVLRRSTDKKRGAFLFRGHVFLREKESVILSKGKNKGELGQPIKKLWGPDPKRLFYPKENPRLVMKVLEDKFYEVYEERIKHEIERRFNK